MDYRFEMVPLPVTDVDRAKAFYVSLGWNCDVDYPMGPDVRVIQFTPPGSACSIVFGVPVDAAPGSYKGMNLCVTDVEAARADLVERGIDVSDFFHFGESGMTAGLPPERTDFAAYCSFADPDGNTWMIQEVPSRGTKTWHLS